MQLKVVSIVATSCAEHIHVNKERVDGHFHFFKHLYGHH